MDINSNKAQDHLIEIMESNRYKVDIDPPYIQYHYKKLNDRKFTINYLDIEGFFKEVDDLVNYLINYYKSIHGNEIKRIEKVEFRDKRLNDILKNII